MKVLSVLLVTFLGSISMAGGRFTVGTQVFEGQAAVHPILGVSVDQHLLGKLFVQSYAGIGSRPDEGVTKHWASGKLGLDYRMNGISVGAGYGLNSQPDDLSSIAQVANADQEQSVYMKIGIQLW